MALRKVKFVTIPIFFVFYRNFIYLDPFFCQFESVPQFSFVLQIANMNFLEDLRKGIRANFETHWQSLILDRFSLESIRALPSYLSVLRESLVISRELARIHGFALVFLDRRYGAMLSSCFESGRPTFGPDPLILADLGEIGVDWREGGQISKLKPLPNTLAFIAYAYYQVQHLNPIGYFGFLFAFENAQMELLQNLKVTFLKKDIPERAFTFFNESGVRARKFNECYEKAVSDIPFGLEDRSAILDATQQTIHLYFALMRDALNTSSLSNKII